MTEPIITRTELRSALVRTLEELAPMNGPRTIPARVYADVVLDLLINASLELPTLDDVDALVAMFRARLEVEIMARLEAKMEANQRHGAYLQ
jgi:hypothetical protein